MAVDPNIKQRTEKIRNEPFLRKVRDNIADGIDLMSEDVVQNIARQDSIEAQFNAVLKETTDKDYNSAPEIKAAQVNSKNVTSRNLKERLDSFEVAIEGKIITKADKLSTMSQADFDSWVATLLDGGPSIFMETLASLQATYPTGSAGVALVRETNPPKIYVWDGAAWTFFGDYTGIEVKDKAVTAEKLGSDVLTEITANNLHAPDFMADGYINTYGEFITDARFKSSHVIPAREGEWFYFDTNSGQYTTHDRDGNYLQGFDVATPGAIQVPQNIFTRFIRKVVDTQYANPVVVRGKYRHSYAPTERVLPTVPDEPIIPTEIKHVEIVHQTNVIDFEKFEVMHYYDAYTGERKPSWLNTSTHIIPCKAGDSIYRHLLESGQISFWDSGENYVSGIDNGEEIIKVPNDSRIAGFRANLTMGDNIRKKTAWISFSDTPVRTRYKFPKEHFIFDGVPTGTPENTAKAETFIKPYRGVTNPVITKGMINDREGVTGVADPFITMSDGRFHMFFEVLSTVTGDEIGHAWSDDLKGWTYTGIVLSIAEHGHRSAYPNVFKVDGEWYMLPDTGWSANLYRATNFPSQWERIVDHLLPNPGAGGYNDTNIFKIHDTWYLTTSYLGEGVRLYKNTTSDFKNSNWERVGGTIIPSDAYETSMRGAGNPRVYDGYVLLPIQVSPADGVYGQYTYLYKISGFESGDIKVANLGKLTDRQHDGGWADGAMHHAAHVEFGDKLIFAVDGWRYTGEYSIGLYIND